MDNIVELHLKHGIVALIDAEDAELVSQYSGWYAAKNRSGNWYVRGYDPKGYVKEGYKQKCVKLHRIVMGVTDRKIEVDHIDHDGLNNCKSNLRLSTKSENQRNRKGIASHKTSSKYIGVFKRVHKTCISWRAGIRVNGVWHTLGHFDSEIKAAKVYNEAAKKYHGQFASLNNV